MSEDVQVILISTFCVVLVLFLTWLDERRHKGKTQEEIDEDRAWFWW